jgi:sugar phosphate permease
MNNCRIRSPIVTFDHRLNRSFWNSLFLSRPVSDEVLTEASERENHMTGSDFRWKARHSVLSMLFISTVVSGMDRLVMSAAVPFIAKDFGLSALQSGFLMSVFFAGYAIAQVPGGLIADRFGVRRVATAAMLWWSVFATITGSATSLIFMLIARFLFGLGEGVYPAAAFKTVAVWFPVKERATANAIKLASTPFGGALSPLLVVAVMSFGTWRTVFHVLLIPGLVISLLFWTVVRDDPSDSPKMTAEELVEIEGAEPVRVSKTDLRIGFTAALREPGMLRYFLILFTCNIGNYGFTSWLPTYLVKARGFSATQMGVTASLPLFAATLGCIAGGLVSDRFFRNNRRIPIVAAQIGAALFLYLTLVSSSTIMLVICQTFTGFFFFVFGSSFWALPITTMPRSVMGIVSGFINMAGQIAAFVAPTLVGYLVGITGGDYRAAFVLMIVSVLLSCALVFTLPKHRAVAA